MTNEVHFLTL